MVEKSTEYDEEFFVDDCYYVLYVSDVSREVEYHSNPKTDDTIEEVLSEETDDYSITYEISDVKIDKGNGNIKKIDYDEKFKKLLFRNIAQNYINTKYTLYPHEVNENTEYFEISVTHNEEEYIVEFKRE